jgi:putative sterol carrier protein
MAWKFPSDEWGQAFKNEVNGSASYRAAAAGWTHGPVALVVRGEPSLGLADDVALWLDLDRGECKAARMVSAAEAAKAPFCITGEYARWKSVMRKELDPIKGMMQKKLELKGQMTIIVKFVNASKELVEASTRVPTQFLDEK